MQYRGDQGKKYIAQYAVHQNLVKILYCIVSLQPYLRFTSTLDFSSPYRHVQRHSYFQDSNAIYINGQVPCTADSDSETWDPFQNQSYRATTVNTARGEQRIRVFRIPDNGSRVTRPERPGSAGSRIFRIRIRVGSRSCWRKNSPDPG